MEGKSISLLFSILLFSSLPTVHSLWFHSASSHFSLSPHNHFAPTPISHFPAFSISPILSLIHSVSICLWVSVSISIYVSLFGIYLRGLSWSPNFIFLSLPLYLIISLCTRLKLPHAGWGGGKQRWIREGKKEEEEGWKDEAAEDWEQGLSYSMFIGSCQLQSTLWCIIQVLSSFCQTHFPFCFPTCSLSPLTLFLFPPPPPALSTSFPSLLISSHLPPLAPSFLLPALWSLSAAVQSNPLMAVWECCKCGGSFPWANALLNITALCEALSMRQTHFISTVPDVCAILPNYLNELGLHLKWADPGETKLKNKYAASEDWAEQLRP